MDSILTGYAYLQPPVEVNLIQHDPSYVKSGYKETAQRKIFYAVPLDDFELSKIRDLEAALIQKGIRLPPGWNERETLRYIYGSKFNMETAIANIQLSLRWRGARNNSVISPEATRLLESGAVYTYGRDALFRPIVIIDFGKLNTQNFDIENFQIALITLLDILKEYCFVPGRVENWIVILDTRRINFSQFPLKELSPIKTLLTACYPVSLERLIVVNASESVFSSWKNIESLVDQATLKKIIILEAHETDKIHSILPKNQLEAKFGGNLPDLTKWWIPRVPFSSSSPSKSNTNTNLESSLARLSHQIETVEGKFQKMFSPDNNKFRNSQTTSPNYQGQTSANLIYTSSPTKASGFPEPRSYNSYSNNQSQVLQSPYSREQYAEREKKSSYPMREYEDISRTRTQYVTPNVIEYTRESYPRVSESEVTKKSAVPVSNNDNKDETKAPENSVTEQSIHYDFNDNNLIDLIMSENDSLLTNKRPTVTKQIVITQNQEGVTRSGNYTDANREVLKSIPRSSTGDNRPKTLNDYNTQPNRATYLPDSIITRHEPLINNGEAVKRSTPYYSSTYTTSNVTTTYVARNNDYSTQPNPRFIEGRTEYEIAKSNLPTEHAKSQQPRSSNQPGYSSTMRTSQVSNQGQQYEEWNPQKYIKKKEEDEEVELEGGHGFCGLCVKSRKKEKAVKA